MHFVCLPRSYLIIESRKKEIGGQNPVSHTDERTHTSRNPRLTQPAGLNYLNRGNEGEGEDGVEEEAHELRS